MSMLCHSTTVLEPQRCSNVAKRNRVYPGKIEHLRIWQSTLNHSYSEYSLKLCYSDYQPDPIGLRRISLDYARALVVHVISGN